MSNHKRDLLRNVTVFLFCSISSVAFADTEVARLALVNGNVTTVKSAEVAAGKAMAPNDPIYNNDVVKTGEGSAAKLLFSDQSVIDLGPNSAFKVSDYALKDVENRTGTFSLLYGKIRALVTKKVGPGGKVEVKAGQTVMGVRGTEFMVDSPQSTTAGGSPGQTTLVVMAGQVAVTQPGGGPPVSIGAGQMMVASPSGITPTTTTTTTSGGASSSSDSSAKQDSSATTTTTTTTAAESSGTSGTAATSGGGGMQVVSVGAEQAQAMMTGAKTQDNTFMASVNLAPSQSSGSGSPGGMSMLGNMIAGNVALPAPRAEGAPPPPPTMTNTNFLPPVNIIPGNKVTVTVTIQ